MFISIKFRVVYCPICQSKDTRVIDSRVASDGMAIRRRRECIECNYRFSTIEGVELLDIVVVKNDSRRESYSHEKLRQGIIHSLIKRPFTQEAFDKLIYAIERDIQKLKKREITSKELGEFVMKYLRRFDKVAYIRFASIYRAFEDVNTFQHEIRSLENNKHDGKSKKKI